MKWLINIKYTKQHPANAKAKPDGYFLGTLDSSAPTAMAIILKPVVHTISIN